VTTPSLASAENWAMCDPHDLFLERAAKVEHGGERAFIEAQIEAFSSRAHLLEEESRRWHGDAPPVRKSKKSDRGNTSPLGNFVGERAAAYRAYAQALESALALLAPADGK
jgi:hypothetical protein